MGEGGSAHPRGQEPHLAQGQLDASGVKNPPNILREPGGDDGVTDLTSLRELDRLDPDVDLFQIASWHCPSPSRTFGKALHAPNLRYFSCLLCTTKLPKSQW